jgi:hypothetical protein
MKDILAATCSLPPSYLIARSTSLFRGWRARKFFASTHLPTTYNGFVIDIINPAIFNSPCDRPPGVVP